MKTKGTRYSVNGITTDVYPDGSVQFSRDGEAEGYPIESFNRGMSSDGGCDLLLDSGFVDGRIGGEPLSDYCRRVGKTVCAIVG